MYRFDLTCESGINDFLDLLWYYMNNSRNEEIIRYRIGLQSALLLQDFVASYLEYDEEKLKEYALYYFGGQFGTDFE